ncbi:hypothetical protein HK100_003750 [Physocladia obscura]|uniref:Uncharacterized protein n=1 Tax=Physocladia obscura TaxID=109957 RepID=A0AAD5T936_9FUNG|nr:hypothetical protein HK100_003750 [Physocladia obscura]
MEAPPPASAPLPTQGLAYSQPHPLRNRYPHSHLHSHSLADGREEGGQTDRDKASVVIMHTRLTQKNTASSKTAMKTKGKNNKGPASVLLVAVRTPADVLSVRNELARVERRDAAEAATATAAATSTPLADAAAFFGGIAASLLPPLDFHARAASATAKRARDTELLVYANLSYACVRGTPCLWSRGPRHVS